MAEDEFDSLTERFWAVSRRLREQSRRSLAPFDLTPSHGRALSILDRHGAMRLTGLAEHLRIAPRSATEVIDALTDKGLTERAPDPADRRAAVISLTDQGSALADQIRTARREAAKEFFAALSPQDRRTLSRMLATLADDSGVL